jgi:Leucine-rich repeat (LRR) protein
MSSGLASRTWRRCLRISVRGLIVLVLVIGAGLGWVVRGARIQREAVAALERGRGTVKYNGEHIFWDSGAGWHDIRPEETWAPLWLVNSLGVDYFYHVTTVFLSQLPGGTEMVSVGRLSSLEKLDLGDGVIEDDDLTNVTGLTELSSLVLSRARITDAGLVHLSGLANLSKLNLRGTRITDAGLEQLKGLKKLSYLDLRFTRVTDEGLKHLKGLTKLTELEVDFTSVTEAGKKGLVEALPRLSINHH